MKKRAIPEAFMRQCTKAICKASLLCAASELKAARILKNHVLDFAFKFSVEEYYPVAVVPRLDPTIME